ELSKATSLSYRHQYSVDREVSTSNFNAPLNLCELFNDEIMNNESISLPMSVFQGELNEHGIAQDKSKGLLSLLDGIIIRIIEKLSSEDIANLADTCIKLREVVRKMTTGDDSLSDFSIESIDELDCTCE
ncbi:hypothetical protein LOAG_08238, partial [Loa loa]